MDLLWVPMVLIHADEKISHDLIVHKKVNLVLPVYPCKWRYGWYI